METKTISKPSILKIKSEMILKLLFTKYEETQLLETKKTLTLASITGGYIGLSQMLLLPFWSLILYDWLVIDWS